jgi:hypothetical protein
MGGRVLADEMVPARICELLRIKGHGVREVSLMRDGPFGLDDATVFAIAQAAREVLLTANRKHFLPLARANRHYGLVTYVPAPLHDDWIAERIHRTITARLRTVGHCDQFIADSIRRPERPGIA